MGVTVVVVGSLAAALSTVALAGEDDELASLVRAGDTGVVGALS